MTISRRQIGTVAFLALTATVAAPALAETTDEAAVADAVATLTKAMLGADRAKLDSLVSDKLSYGHSGGVIQDKKDFVEVIAAKKTVYKSIELSKQTVSVAGNNAIVRHAWESESGTGDGKWNASKIGVLQVWQKEAGGWKLLARQAFKV
jgi:ketosteroid isomerase-like protein